MDDEHGHSEKNENANPIHIVDGQKVLVLVCFQVNNCDLDFITYLLEWRMSL